MTKINDLFDQIEKTVADLDAKKKVADDLATQAGSANKALGEAETLLESLRNQVHDLLGEKTARVRKY
jgi:ABC-type transporter Mla subunit MlaD